MTEPTCVEEDMDGVRRDEVIRRIRS